MKKLPQYLMMAMIAIGLLVTVIAFVAGDPDDPDTWGFYEPGLYIMYIYFILTVLAVLGASIMAIMNKPGNIKQSGIAIGGLLVVVAISYMLASGDVPDTSTYEGISESTSKWAGTGLYVLYIIFVLTIGSILYSTVTRFFK